MQTEKPPRHKQQPGIQGRLVLSRREGENIVLRTSDGLKVVVGVCEIRNGKVRLGIVATQAVVVNREEVDRQIHGEDYGSE